MIAKLLGPVLYGIRNAFDLVLTYESFSNLGTFIAMRRQVPYYRGGNNKERAEQMVTSAFGVNILYSLFVGTTLILVALYLRKIRWEIIYVDFFFFLGLLIVTNRIKEFYLSKLTIDKNFYLLSRAQILYGFVLTVTCVILAYYLHFRGVLMGVFIADVIYIGYLFKKVKGIPAIRISFSAVWELVRVGFPIMVVGLLLVLISSADRIVIIAMLSKEALGFYGVAAVATSVIGTVPSAIYSVTLPRLMEKLGRTKDIYRIKHYLIDPTILTAYFVPFVIGVLYFGIHVPVEYFLNKFLPSINVVKILSLGLFFSCFSMPVSICYALNKRLNVMYIAFPVAILNFILNYSFVLVGWGIKGVALGTGISYFVFSSVMIYYALRQFKGRIEESFKSLLLIYAPFLYSLLLMLTVDKCLYLNIVGFWSDVMLTSMKIGLFSLLYIFVFVLIRKQNAFIKLIDNLPSLKRVIF